MKKIKLFFLVFLIGCAPNYTRYADNVTTAFAKEMAREKGLILGGLGGSMMDNIKEISVILDCDKVLGLEEARKLVVDCADRFLDRINRYKKIQPYLSVPFDYHNIYLLIVVMAREEQQQPEDAVSTVYLRRGKINYGRKDPTSGRCNYFYQESYQEAKTRKF